MGFTCIWFKLQIPNIFEKTVTLKAELKTDHLGRLTLGMAKTICAKNLRIFWQRYSRKLSPNCLYSLMPRLLIVDRERLITA